MAIDYVLVYKNSGLIYCVIELDGPTHDTDLRRERDKRLDALMDSAGIPLLHIPVNCVNEKPDIWKFRKSEKNTG
jgi:very-short-patch-repair endonuclease